MKFLKVLLLQLLFLLYGVHFVFGSGYYITTEQMERLTNEITTIQSSNNNLITKLQLQQEQYSKLMQAYETKYTLAQEQLETYKSYYQKSRNKESIYKYFIAGGFVAGLVLGIIIMK